MSDAYLLFPKNQEKYEVTLLFQTMIGIDPKNFPIVKVPIIFTKNKEGGVDFLVGDMVNGKIDLTQKN